MVIADATQLQTHRMVNIADAKAVAVLTSADLTNIETGLSVRESLGARWDDVPVVRERGVQISAPNAFTLGQVSGDRLPRGLRPEPSQVIRRDATARQAVSDSTAPLLSP